ncbi:cysteine hydrolase [Paracoccus pantotrophus]|uniref:Cysteine hydrolase n=1 Tax=Paracoccus pantotrophus TaxID=82367 RepID=A0A7H9BPC6_PARPN|nr:isochorismatase family cysteine hydrolase [Paracoccus pantotrophus]QLH13072.1 cysteine hydrolase [Paracoccus pantotrophus]
MKNDDLIVSVARINDKLDPRKTALVLIDYQNDWFHKDGAYSKTGFDIGHMTRIVDPTVKLINFCHDNDITVVVLTYIVRSDVDGGPPFKKRPALREDGGRGLREGSFGANIIPELPVSAEKYGDWFIQRKRMSGFYQTGLEQLLRDLGKDTILITGVATGSCCESTARDANFRNIKAVMVHDCLGTMGGNTLHPITKEPHYVSAEEMHFASLRNCQMIVCDVMGSEECMAELASGSA